MDDYFCLIPARGGSKGLPGKNIRLLAGKPLIAYTIEAALAASLARVYVSSDSEEILSVARGYGAIPIMRPGELASDTASSQEVIFHALKHAGNQSAHCILLQPTSPLRTSHHITQAIRQYEEQQASSLMSVCASAHHPYKSLTIKNNALVSLMGDNDKLHTPRQQLPSAFEQNGAIYITNTALLQQYGTFLIPPCSAYVMKRSDSIDIDDLDDFMMAEALLRSSSALI